MSAENQASTSSRGFIKSLAGLGDNLLATLQERIELVSVEVKEEKYRLVRLLIWIGAAVFTGAMTLSFATLTLVYLLWDTARLAALAGVTVFYGAALAWVILSLRRLFTHEPKPFEATIGSIKEDRACIRKRT